MPLEREDVCFLLYPLNYSTNIYWETTTWQAMCRGEQDSQGPCSWRVFIFVKREIINYKQTSLPSHLILHELHIMKILWILLSMQFSWKARNDHKMKPSKVTQWSGCNFGCQDNESFENFEIDFERRQSTPFHPMFGKMRPPRPSNLFKVIWLTRTRTRTWAKSSHSISPRNSMASIRFGALWGQSTIHVSGLQENMLIL